MSGIGFVDGEPNSKKDSERFKKFWPADVHMIGKEIIRFHAVYWPAFLMAAFPDKKLSEYMPGRIQAHGWLLFEQEKMSKSKGNVAYAEPIVKSPGQRRSALLPIARSSLRPGRKFQQRCPDHALQRRFGKRSGQSRQPHAHDD